MEQIISDIHETVKSLAYAARPTATVTSLKNTWNQGPDQALQEKPLSVRNCAAQKLCCARNVAADWCNVKVAATIIC